MIRKARERHAREVEEDQRGRDVGDFEYLLYSLTRFL
jgi:hypothetical protein